MLKIKYKPKKQLDLNNCILLKMHFDLNYTEIQKNLRVIFKECFKDTPLRNFKYKKFLLSRSLSRQRSQSRSYHFLSESYYMFQKFF